LFELRIEDEVVFGGGDDFYVTVKFFEGFGGAGLFVPERNADVDAVVVNGILDAGGIFCCAVELDVA
jgi:hypothetical protein